MLTEGFIECVNCGSERCFIRYGSQGWWQFDICFDCPRYVQYDGSEHYTRDEVINILFKHYGVDEINALVRKMMGETSE